ncbi:glutamine amidotransferase [Amantichitinum ursilacus]|uniref:GMP synthase [glutamine-hydrolyzing] n=1 Tax=Amantichitinum ursilacus TaxID=857265 RepID=A0A0N1JTY3_9NEIS|nr:glutamine amidotransferase [Amantichitinum ursilacus]KPC54765.1 GMP synthase [glutamine-hydrolyzing] [Amantichitinum ursilacus]
MPHAQLITHIAFEDAGTLAPVLTQAGYTLQTLDACSIDFSQLDPAAADLLIVAGGPIGVYEGDTFPFLDSEIAFIRARLQQQKPVLGICLGAQLMATALGAKVYPGRNGKEIGWGPLMAGPDIAQLPGLDALIKADFPLFHWHGDTFDLPAGAALLASTAAYPHQAYSLGHYALGLQFHPEVITPYLERWYVANAGELAHAGIDIPTLRAAGWANGPALEQAATAFWHSVLAWMQLPLPR